MKKSVTKALCLLLIIMCITGVVLILYHVNTYYKIAQNKIERRIDYALQKALNAELLERSGDMPIYVFQSKNLHNDDNKEDDTLKGKAYVENENGKRVLPDAWKDKRKLDITHEMDIIQTIMHESGTVINIMHVDSMFHNNIVSDSLLVESLGITIKYKPKDFYVRNKDSVENNCIKDICIETDGVDTVEFAKSASYIASLPLGISNEIEVNGYVHYSAFYPVKFMSVPFFFLYKNNSLYYCYCIVLLFNTLTKTKKDSGY